MESTNSELPFPSGWFVIAFSKELKKGKVLPCTLMGQELVLFRTKEGIASALDAYCPHLGAHLGHGGKVVAGCIRCPFHHLKFGTDGQCLDHKHIKAKTWPLEERDGLIFVYHGNPEKKHELPHLAKDGWNPYKKFSLKLKSHPQEVAENSVDTTHFQALHGMPLTTINVVSSDTYTFTTQIYYPKNQPLMRKWVMTPGARSHLVGLGYFLITLDYPVIGIASSALLATTPIDTHYSMLRVMFFTKLTPPSLLKKLLSFLTIWRLFYLVARRTIRQDVRIWNYKRHLRHPILTPNDGPIQAFRKWAQRFYE